MITLQRIENKFVIKVDYFILMQTIFFFFFLNVKRVYCQAWCGWWSTRMNVRSVRNYSHSPGPRNTYGRKLGQLVAIKLGQNVAMEITEEWQFAVI